MRLGERWWWCEGPVFFERFVVIVWMKMLMMWKMTEHEEEEKEVEAEEEEEVKMTIEMMVEVMKIEREVVELESGEM